MGKKEYRLNEGTNELFFDLKTTDVEVYPDSTISSPVIEYTGDFEFNNKNGQAVIKEKNDNNIVCGNNNVIINNSGTFINGVVSSGSVVIINGKVISGNNCSINISSNNEKRKVNLYYPKNKNDIKLDFNNMTGDIEINDLYLLRLVIESKSGDITLNDIDSIYTYIKTMSGDVKASIVESMLNYNLNLKTMSGDTTQETIEKVSPIILESKNNFYASTMSGDIKVLFKGKNN